MELSDQPSVGEGDTNIPELVLPLSSPPTLEAGGISTSEPKPLPLWRSLDFMKFWAGQCISKLGDQFAFLTIPLLLLAITHSPLALGLFTAASYIPYLLFGLPAGALIDRLPRRRVMITCDIARMLILIGEATLVASHLLTITTLWLLYVGTALYGVATIFFDMGYLSALPNLVAPAQLLSGNSYLQASDSTSRLAGPALASWVFQVLGAAATLFTDAASFAVSVVSLLLIPRTFRAVSPRTSSEQHSAPTKDRSMLREIGQGIRFLWKEPVLRWMMLLIAFVNSTPAYQLGVYRMREHLHFSAETFGLVLAFGAAGGIVGSLVTSWLRRRYGMVPTILVGAALWSLFSLIYASSLPSWAFMLAEALIGACSVMNQIVILTLRQSLTPDYLMGRVQSVARLMAWSLIPVGAVIGTALAAPLGATTVIIGACVLGTLASLGMFLSPVRRVHEKVG